MITKYKRPVEEAKSELMWQLPWLGLYFECLIPSRGVFRAHAWVAFTKQWDACVYVVQRLHS